MKDFARDVFCKYHPCKVLPNHCLAIVFWEMKYTRVCGFAGKLKVEEKRGKKKDLHFGGLFLRKMILNYLGIITASITCTTPLPALMSAVVTLAPSTITLPSLIVIVTSAPFTVLAFIPSVRSVLITLPATTW